MDAGFATLAYLKAKVLPVKTQDRADWDDQLVALGLGVADRFDRHCSRHFRRRVGATVQHPGDTSILTLPGYPVESVAQVEHRDEAADAWTVVANAIRQLNSDSGVLILKGPLGWYESRIRVTYTGGYWHDATGSDTLPAGAVEIPEDIRLAWVTQCRIWWAAADHTGQHMAARASAPIHLATLDLAPEVLRVLDSHRRIAW